MRRTGWRLTRRSTALLLLLLSAVALATGCTTTNPDVSLAGELGASGFETRIDDRGVTVLVTDVLFAYDSDARAPDDPDGRARKRRVEVVIASGE